MHFFFIGAFGFLTSVCGSSPGPEQGKIEKPQDRAAPAVLKALLKSDYDRLVKAAAQVEKLTGDASLLSKGKHSKAAERVFVQDPKAITSDAAQLVAQAYAVMETKPPQSQQKPGDELKSAYHEILAAAEGIELVRRHAGTLSSEKLATFAAEVNADPVEDDLKKLEEDLKVAEEDMEATEEELEKAKAKETNTGDKDDVTEAHAANKAANQGLAEADHEIHGGDELVGKAEGDKNAEEAAAAKKADAKVEVKTATAEHKTADAAHEEADDKDDAQEDRVEKLEKALEEHKENYKDAKEAHDAHPDAKVKSGSCGVRHLASYTAILSLSIFM